MLGLGDARRFGLRSLDRVLGAAWRHPGEKQAGKSVRSTQADFTQGPTHAGLLLHVVSYSDPAASHREVAGLLDDYAFTALACLDAYEATADLSYFKFARAITDAMIARFYDATGGGFFDSEPAAEGASLGVLATRRKPLQDSPTPAGNPMAAIALVRMHHYTGEASYRDKAEQTLETFAGVAEQFGIFAATYGIAVLHFLESPVQVVVIADEGDESGRASVSRRRSRFSRSARPRCIWRRIRRSRRIFLRHWRRQFPIFRSWRPGSPLRCSVREPAASHPCTMRRTCVGHWKWRSRHLGEKPKQTSVTNSARIPHVSQRTRDMGHPDFGSCQPRSRFATTKKIGADGLV